MATVSIAVKRISALVLSMAVALVLCTQLTGCDEKASADVATVTIAGKKFQLEVAAHDEKRFLGLGKRREIDPDGGMVFVFTDARVREFVMRDCYVDIDIIYLDAGGRVLAMHEMKFEPERGEDEKADENGANPKYDARLKKYSSRFPSQIVVELKGGKIKELGVKEGDLVKLDAAGLKQMAR